MKSKKLWFTAILSTVLVAVLAVTLVGCNPNATEGSNYTIKQIDLSAANSDAKYKDLFSLNVVDDDNDYMAHPDSVLGLDGSIMTVYPLGHGKGAVQMKTSADGGKSWSARRTDLPKSWEKSEETPTIYRLYDKSVDDTVTDAEAKMLVMVSANPSWGVGHGNGFNASVSRDDGKTWTDFKTFHGWGEDTYVNPIVAMASLTRLKKTDGSWDDKWMGLFHDYDFFNYKSILSFDADGNMHWSDPVKYFEPHRDIEKSAQMCEVEVIRSNNGKGDVLCLLGRSNAKVNNSLISFSMDEGETWTIPRETPAALSGERHKAEWIGENRLMITFRSIERDPVKLEANREKSGQNWYSEGWIAWIGTFDDLRFGLEGQYRVKLAHTYLSKQTAPSLTANGDTGYCGNVTYKKTADGKILMPYEEEGDLWIMTSSYGIFDPNKKTSDGKERKTSICAKAFSIKTLDEYAKSQGVKLPAGL